MASGPREQGLFSISQVWEILLAFPLLANLLMVPEQTNPKAAHGFHLPPGPHGLPAGACSLKGWSGGVLVVQRTSSSESPSVRGVSKQVGTTSSIGKEREQRVVKRKPEVTDGTPLEPSRGEPWLESSQCWSSCS